MIAAALAAVAVALPNVPGAYNPAVTQRTVSTTICRRGWTATVRPPESYTWPIKRRLLAGRPSSAFQLDHLVSLELGGAPRSLANLWLQPIAPARRDDRLENSWKRAVCSGELLLAQARRIELLWKRRNG